MSETAGNDAAAPTDAGARTQIVRAAEWQPFQSNSDGSDPAKDWKGFVTGQQLGANVTLLFFSTDEPGEGPALHVHDYDEVFVIRAGRALFTIGEQKIEASAGDVLFGPAGVPHKFHNLGPGRLETTDIHLSPVWEQTDLPDPETEGAARSSD